MLLFAWQIPKKIFNSVQSWKVRQVEKFESFPVYTDIDIQFYAIFSKFSANSIFPLSLRWKKHFLKKITHDVMLIISQAII